MSNSRSRSRAHGAFGNNKPRPIKRDFSAPAPAPAENKSKEPTFADKLITYAQPILEQAGNNHTAAKGAMNVAILIWNASIEGEAKIKEAKEKLTALPGATAEQVEELVTIMLERKKELYPEEKLSVTNFILKFSHRKGAQFRVSAVNINPEGVTKADLSDMVKMTP
jgi:cell division GTPase FtsZ